jgi:hypothetical protein
MSPAPVVERHKVGELRPSQLLFSFGIGSVVDLPRLSVMVMGLDDWERSQLKEIGEERLLAAVRKQLGSQVKKLYLPPAEDESAFFTNPFDKDQRTGVPVVPFPRWMRCPWCNLLAPVSTGLYKLKTDPYRPDRAQYIHANCPKAGSSPAVIPARFLVACERGHLDDFPWVKYVHQGKPVCNGPLRLREEGVSGEAADIWITCDGCGSTQSMARAFGDDAGPILGRCRGRRPHLRDFDEKPCPETAQTILLGASNSWFPIALSALSVPAKSNKLEQLVEEYWVVLEKAASVEIVAAFRNIGQLNAFHDYSDQQLWELIKAKKEGLSEEDGRAPDLKLAEWEVFSKPDADHNGPDFKLKEVEPPKDYAKVLSRVVLVERLREVRALTGFTRIESPGDLADEPDVALEKRGSLSRRPPDWVPASEVRGEGVFLQFNEKVLGEWLDEKANVEREKEFREAHRRWRQSRKIEPAAADFPGCRYVLLHSFAHVLMRQFAIECGYSTASIRERIYARGPEEEGGPMAGILLYTAASDSEGTLGGLVALGEPQSLGRHIEQALEHARLCASDPLCVEHHPVRDGVTLHGAACHACLFAPETSCERGNKYMDRTLLVPTLKEGVSPFFGVS